MKTSKTQKIIIYCDGACSGNQFSRNKGGWGAVLIYQDKTKELSGGEQNTTNQRMELTSCIKALEQIKIASLPIEVHSDSAYLVNCIQQGWYKQWQRNGWKNSKKQPIENKDLWQRLIELMLKYKITFHKVEGHKGVHFNERADYLARKGIDDL
ncbi:MAG TPA: ribonuclease HI [Bacteroidota bacterium]|nr:ribonuclease HI [Bacteroidota bacterium]